MDIRIKALLGAALIYAIAAAPVLACGGFGGAIKLF
jgi:hypothetical protein